MFMACLIPWGYCSVELRHLRYFVTLAEELHFGRAAQRLNIAQPPLSRQIQQLEEELGAALFERNHRRIRLTEAGEVFLRWAKRILDDTDLAMQEIQRMGRGEQGYLSIGFVVAASYEIVPTVLREFRSRYPDVKVHLHEMTTVEQVEALSQGRLHAGFARSPICNPIFTERVVQHETFIVALPAHHPLASTSKVRLTDLKEEGFILFHRQMGPDHYDQIVGMCVSHGFHPKVVQEAVQMSTIINLVASGLGVSIVPSSVACMQRRGVAYRTLSHPTPGFDISIVWNQQAMSPALRNFLDVVHELFEPPS
jgi:DNA-binding transcriptional LysR family regulator